MDIDMDTDTSAAGTTTGGTSDRDDHNVWVGLAYRDPMAARAWLRALGFVDGVVVDGDAPGEVRHSEMLWPEGGRVMVSSRAKDDRAFVPSPAATTVYVVSDDPDAVWERVLHLGATVLRPLEETDYGSRGFSVADPEGTSWSFGTYAG